MQLYSYKKKITLVLFMELITFSLHFPMSSNPGGKRQSSFFLYIFLEANQKRSAGKLKCHFLVSSDQEQFQELSKMAFVKSTLPKNPRLPLGVQRITSDKKKVKTPTKIKERLCRIIGRGREHK